MDSERIPRGLATGVSERIVIIKIPYIKIPCGLAAGSLQFYQEIYDDNGNLVEIHEKFPVGKGHIKIREE